MGVERKTVAVLAAATSAILLTHGFIAFLRSASVESGAIPAAAFSVLAVAAAFLAAPAWIRFDRWEYHFVSGLGSGFLAMLVATFALMAGGWVSLALVVAAAIGSMVGGWVLRRLPHELDGLLTRRRVLSFLWMAVGLAALVQIGRLGAFMTDPSFDWWIVTRNPLWTKHECVSAYVYGADLSLQEVDNLYHAVYYPAAGPDAKPQSRVDGLVPDDSFQYPPPFLLLPRLALWLTPDFARIRAVWLVLQFAAFTLVALLLARWISGTAGQTAALLIPLVWISVPVLSNFQYGQFHLSAVILAVAAMLLHEAGRRVGCGALLAAAILSKIFPAILLVPLAVRRQWATVGWTALFGAAYAALGWAVLGNAPFVAFFGYHVPRLASGAAFDLTAAWSEVLLEYLAANLSPFYLVLKLDALGVPAMTNDVARRVHSLYGMALLGLVLWNARRAEGSRLYKAQQWLALLSLASLASAGAWGDYVTAVAVWLLTLLVADLVAGRGTAWFLGACWVFLFLNLGVMPYPGLGGKTGIVLSIIGLALMLALNLWVLLRPPSAAPLESPS